MLAFVHVFVYNEYMKKRDLEKKLRELGWDLLREGANHEIWTNGRGVTGRVPRHREIREGTAKKIIRKATRNRG